MENLLQSQIENQRALHQAIAFIVLVLEYT